MLRLLLRRILAQRRLLVSVTALVAVAATLLGVCALLLGPTQERAFAREVQRSEASDVEVDAFLVSLDSEDLPAVRADTDAELRAVLGALGAEVTATAASDMLTLGPGRLGYLAAGDGIAPRAELVSGRWPAPGGAEVETAVPQAAAQALGLSAGQRLTLGATGTSGDSEAVSLVVVGTFRPRSALGWESDPLVGAGLDPAYGDGARPEAAYGPFVVDDATFLAAGAPVARLRITARPDLARADLTTVRAAVSALAAATGLLTERLGDRVRIVRVTSALPATLERAEAQQGASRSIVLVAVLLGAILSLAALLLAGRLVAAVRDEERVLLLALGASRRQQLGAAGLEALLLAGVAALVALPAAVLLHTSLTGTAGPAAAGLDQGPTPSAGLVVVVLVSALVLVPVLTSTALDTGAASAATRRRWALARSGADVALVAVALVAAALSWRQLAAQPATTAGRGDLALTLAPALFLTATTVLVVRLVPLLLRVGSRLALRSRSLVLPLSLQQAARRPHPVTAMVLIAAAVAAAVFGLGLRATWERSQVDQAALRVGTDLSLTLPAGARTEDVEAVADVAARATDDGGTSSAVLARPVSIGRYVGDDGPPPALVALDSPTAARLLRGRLEVGDWRQVAAALDPGPAITGPPLGDGAALQGRLSTSLPATAAATAVVEDAAGLRRTLTAAEVPLDGTAHPLVWDEPLGEAPRLLSLGVHVVQERVRGAGEESTTEIALTVSLPGADPGEGEWQTRADEDGPVRGPEVTLEQGAGGAELRLGAVVAPGALARGGADVLATSFAPPADVPVALSAELAEALGADVGADLAGVVGDTELALRVVAVLSAVPSVPGRPAVLADLDSLSRGLIAAGQPDAGPDAWWFADPSPQTVTDLRQLDLGEVVTLAQSEADLAGAPLQVTVPTALSTLVVAAVLLLLAGIALVAGADQQRHAAELTRLRAMGLTRRGARRLLLAEHAAFLAPVVLLGVLVGALAAVAVGPLMVRSDQGAVPVPAAVAAWPWGPGLLLIGVVVVGTALVTWIVTVLQVRGSDTAGLRRGDA